MRRKHIFLLLVLTSAFIGILFAVNAKKNPTPPHLPSYTAEEQQAFWAEHFPNFLDWFFQGGLPFPELNERCAMLRGLIQQRYGKDLHINLVTTYNPDSPAVLAGNYIKEGVPELELVVSNVINLHNAFRASGDPEWKPRLQNGVLVSMMHEMDHLAYGYTSEFGKRSPLEELVEDERRAWALTCEHTLRILVEHCHAPLNSSDMQYYHHWLVCNRDENDPRWKEGLWNVYSVTRK